MDSGAPGFQEHGFGSLIRYGSGAVSYLHNLYADNFERDPRPGNSIHLDFINNVVFNWGALDGYNEDDTANNPGGYTNYLNYVANLFHRRHRIPPLPMSSVRVPDAAFTQKYYETTNFVDFNAGNPTLNGSDFGSSVFAGPYTPLAAPTPMPEVQPGGSVGSSSAISSSTRSLSLTLRKRFWVSTNSRALAGDLADYVPATPGSPTTTAGSALRRHLLRHCRT